MDHQTTVGGRIIHWLAPHSTQWDKIWISPEFQDLMQKPSWLRDEVMPYISSRPLGWFDPPTDARFYFSSWLMNCVMRRAYSNPLIQDLYVLHEALHSASLDEYFLHAKNPEDALRSNEIQVSLETECWMYIRHPEWVGKTFDDLWVVQPHIQERLTCPDHNQAITTQKEHDLYNLSHTAYWPLQTPNDQINPEHLWWVRRRMSTHALSASDHVVARYEKMADKWIAQISDRITLVQKGRFQLNADLNNMPWKDAVNNWNAYLNEHLYNGLPFGDLQLRTKK